MPKVPPDADRCIFEFTDGRRCRGWRRGNGIFLCHTHQKVHERNEQLKAEAAAPGDSVTAAPVFPNVVPGAAVEVIAGINSDPRDSVGHIHHLTEQVLLMVVNNSISARSATACTQLLRLLLKAQPQFQEECVRLNAALERFRQQAAEEESPRVAAQAAAD